MKQKTNRRIILFAIGAAVTIIATPAIAAESSEIHGTIQFEDAQTIPKGQLTLQFEDMADMGNTRNAAHKIAVIPKSRSGAVNFTLPLPDGLKLSPTLTLVARLERADGWLLARGSAKVKPGKPTSIVLYTVMY